MNMKRIVAALLACACAFSISVTSFAYDRSIIDQVVDSDGEIADTEYDAYAPGSYYYYVIGPSSDYDILTNSDYLRFSMKKKTNGTVSYTHLDVYKRQTAPSFLITRLSVPSSPATSTTANSPLSTSGCRCTSARSPLWIRGSMLSPRTIK